VGLGVPVQKKKICRFYVNAAIQHWYTTKKPAVRGGGGGYRFLLLHATPRGCGLGTRDEVYWAEGSSTRNGGKGQKQNGQRSWKGTANVIKKVHKREK